MILKEDIEQAKERMNAWWDHEILDRPVISYYTPLKGSVPIGIIDALNDDWSLAKNPDGIKETLENFEGRAKFTYFGGEAIPSFMPNYGPGVLAAVFGIEPKFDSNTVWYKPSIKPEEIVGILEGIKLNQNNKWYTRLLKTTEIASKTAKSNYQISVTDIGGVLDILSSFLGPTTILLTMKRNPKIIDDCREILLEKIMIMFNKIQSIIEKYCDGCNSWLNIWNKKRWYPVQCDFIAMLNPKWFKRFALPDIKAQIELLDYSIYHMDGPYQIPYLEELLAIPGLTGIEWVPGVGESAQGAPEWTNLYRKIQKAGKNIVIDTSPEKTTQVYKALNPKGLFVRTYYRSQRLANYMLPLFMGGKEGKIVFEAVDWVKSKGKKKINIEEFQSFLELNNLNIERRLKKELLTSINNYFESWSVF